MSRRPSPVLGIFLTVLIDMLAFGLLIPDIQLRSESLGAKDALRGLLLASFSIAQLLTAPFLGRLSDRIGRRRVLLVTTALSVCGFLFYSHAFHLWELFTAQILLGIAGANIGVAFAYIADVTEPEHRAKSLGSIGAAFGLGFIFGPPIGAWLVSAGGGQPTLLGYVAASAAFTNFLYVLFLLPESTPEPHGTAHSHSHFQAVWRALNTPGLRFLLALFFVANFAFSNLQSTFFLLSVREYRLTQEQGALLLTWVGVVAAVMQGGVLRIVAPRLGEVRMLRLGYLLQAPSLAAIPFLTPWIPVMLVLLTLGIGNGLSNPSVNSLISRSAPRDMQGGIFGVTQSAGAFARILGPITGSVLFDQRHYLPYLLAGGLMAIPLLGAWAFLKTEMRD